MSKGSRPRPYSVSLEKFNSNFDAIFRKNQTSGCGCGRSPTGKCIGWHGLTEEEYQKQLTEYTENNK